MVTTGGVTSTVKARASVSVRPARSVAVTETECAPSPVGSASGELHGAAAAASTTHVNVADRLAAKVTAPGLFVTPAGPLTVRTGGSALSATAARASTRPSPTANGPKAPTAVAVSRCAAFTWSGVSAGFAESCRAPTAAACGAAAEVPKNLNVPPTFCPKNVFAAPSVAVTSGLDSTSGEPRAAVAGTGAK